MVWNEQESRRKYWVTRSLACSALLARSAALTRSLARSFRSLPRSWDRELLMSQNDLVLSHSASMDGDTNNSSAPRDPPDPPVAPQSAPDQPTEPPITTQPTPPYPIFNPPNQKTAPPSTSVQRASTNSAGTVVATTPDVDHEDPRAGPSSGGQGF